MHPALHTYGPRDWREDSSHENGNYNCTCCLCKETFIGHKRRVVCKVCADASRARWDALTPEQRAIEARKNLEAVDDFMRENAHKLT